MSRFDPRLLPTGRFDLAGSLIRLPDVVVMMDAPAAAQCCVASRVSWRAWKSKCWVGNR
jgi:hypothetical protein